MPTTFETLLANHKRLFHSGAAKILSNLNQKNLFTNFLANFVKFLQIPTFLLMKTGFYYMFSCSANGRSSLLRYMAPKLFSETTFIIKKLLNISNRWSWLL